MNKAKFSIDGYGKEYEGYTKGNLWNGWECPLFTKEQAICFLEDSLFVYRFLVENEKEVLYLYYSEDGDDGVWYDKIEPEGNLYPFIGYCFVESFA